MKQVLLSLWLVLVSALCQAQTDWPAKPVRIVVPFAPGGTTDIVARILATELATSLKQPFVIDNRAGAGGNIGAAEVARGAADGYTFLMGTPGTQSINQFLYSKSSFDPEKDFAPVSLAARVPNVLVVHRSVGADNLRDLITLARARPGQLNYSSAGNGTTGHLATELLKSMANVFITHIPYRGSAASLQDLMAGQVQLSIDNLPSAIPHIRSGRLVALGVTSLEAARILPDVPPIASVLPGFEAESWFALMAPAGTPTTILDTLSSMVASILRRPDIAEKLRGIGAEPVGSTPAALGVFIAAETAKWKRVVQVSGAKVD